MELRDYVRVLRRSWMIIVICVALGGLLAASATWRATKMYAASVTMVVSSPDNGEGVASAYQGGLLSQQRVKSYANLVSSERVAARVIRQLHLSQTPESLRAQISAHAVPDTVLLRATVRDADARRAQSVADAVGNAFSVAVAGIETPSDDEPPSVRVSVWEPAKLPVSPVSPQPVRSIALGVLLGLIASIGLALLRHRLDTSVSGEDDARDVTSLPNLAVINHDSDAGRRPLIINARPHSPRAEAFRQLRTNLQFVDVDTGPRSILVSSSVPGEGKTTTICNLAITLAQGGARVCLIEGDLRRPSFGGYLGVESAAGLTSVLIGAAELDDVLQPWGEGRVGNGRIEVLASGPVPPNPSELLGSRGMAHLIDQLHTRFDIVLIDTPPVLPVTDAVVLATRADGVLLVVKASRTRREQLRRAAEALRAVDARMVGTVLNMVPTKGPNAHYYGQYESYAPRGRHARSGANRAVSLPAPDAGFRPARAVGLPAPPTSGPSAFGPGTPGSGTPGSEAAGPVVVPAPRPRTDSVGGTGPTVHSAPIALSTAPSRGDGTDDAGGDAGDTPGAGAGSSREHTAGRPPSSR